MFNVKVTGYKLKSINALHFMTSNKEKKLLIDVINLKIMSRRMSFNDYNAMICVFDATFLFSLSTH